MNTHTKGPWIHDDTFGLIMAGKEEICALHSGKIANAKLIAAAPEMLEALKRAVSALEANGAPNCEAVKESKAAIAKAESRFS